MIMLAALWRRVWPYVAVVGAVLAGLFAVRQSGKAAGKQDIRQEINEADAKARERARNVEDKTAAMADDDITDELSRDWVRNRKG